MGLKSGKVNVVDAIPTYNSTTDAWIQWHKELKSNFGKKMANNLWLKAWKIRGSSKLNTSDLRSYLDKQGIKLDTNAWDDIVDFGGGIGDFIGNTFQAGQVLTIGLGVIIVGGIGMLVYNIAKNPNKAVSLGTTIATRGIIK
jgi:hypothetical protein